MFALIILTPIFLNATLDKINLAAAPPLRWLAYEKRRIRLLQTSNINPIMAETMLVSCKVPTQILSKKEAVGLRTAYALSDSDVYNGILNERASLEVYW